MATNSPIKMSQFQGISDLYTGSYLVGIGIDDDLNPINVRIPSISASYSLGKQRWILPAVTSPSDTRGEDGSESYGTGGEYWIKAGGTWHQISGSIGGTGSSGTSGQAGSSGTSGANGIAGSSGTSGQNGSSGTSGQNGSSGTSGQNGSSGTSGQNGSSGTSGQSGPTTGDIYSRLIKNISGTITNFSSETTWATPEVFNVKDFGALGDDSTNDTAAILSAINSAQSSGLGTVYFPDGIYRITGSLQLPNNPQCDIALVGNGPNVSVIKQTTNSYGINFNMDNGGTGDQQYQVYIKDLGFHAVGQASCSINVTYGTASISAHSDPSVVIDNVHILSDGSGNYWSNGICLESAWNFKILNSMVCGYQMTSSFLGNGLEVKRLCINGTITNTQFNFWDCGNFINVVDYVSGASGQNTEGLLIDKVYMVPVTDGLRAYGNSKFIGTPSGIYDIVDWQGRPVAARISLLNIVNSHIDSRDSGIPLRLRNVNNYCISNNLFINGEFATACVKGENLYEGSLVGNIFFNPSGTSAASVYLSGYYTVSASVNVYYSSSANIVSSNVFRGGGSAHVLLDSGSIYNKVYGNVGDSFLSITVTDYGTNNLVGSTGN